LNTELCNIVIDAQRSIQKPFLPRPVLVFMDDSQAFECSLRQQPTTACDCGYRARSEKQKIAASPTTQKLGSYFNLLWRSFLEEGCRLSRGHGFSRGCLVWFYRRGFVFKIHHQ
jgi:hypothetical protein